MLDAASAYTPFNTVATVTEFEMAVTYPPENLIRTQQSHTIQLSTRRYRRANTLTSRQLNGFLICSYRLLLECLCVWRLFVAMIVTSSTTSHSRSAVCSSRLYYSRVTINHIETHYLRTIRRSPPVEPLINSGLSMFQYSLNCWDSAPNFTGGNRSSLLIGMLIRNQAYPYTLASLAMLQIITILKHTGPYLDALHTLGPGQEAYFC